MNNNILVLTKNDTVVTAGSEEEVLEFLRKLSIYDSSRSKYTVTKVTVYGPSVICRNETAEKCWALSGGIARTTVATIEVLAAIFK